jgi:hypothetical protein
MRNIQVDPAQKKKLSERYQQFSVVKAIGPNAYWLDTPRDIHNVFHTTLLPPVVHDPLPSQVQDDYQPPPIIVNGEGEYKIEQIQDVQVVLKRGSLKRQFLCKWKAYATVTWNDEEDGQDTVALDLFEDETGWVFAQEPLVCITQPRKWMRGVL